MGCLGTLLIIAVLAAFVIVLIAYPKQTLGTIAAIVVVAGFAIFLFIENDKEQRRKSAALATKREQSVSVRVVYSPGTCGQAYPLSVAVRNGAPDTLNAVTIYLEAYRPGYSTDLLHSSYDHITWDRILPPGQSATLCYPLPQTIANQSNYPPQTLEFRVGDKLLTFR